MNRQEITEKLKDILVLAMGNTVDLSKCNESSNLITDLGLNSVGVLYVVIAIEEFFNIRFGDVSFGDFQTVGDVIDYIEGQLQK